MCRYSLVLRDVGLATSRWDVCRYSLVLRDVGLATSFLDQNVFIYVHVGTFLII